MAFTPEEADFYYDRGMMPDWAWAQQNGRSAQWNWEYQKNKSMEEYEEREAAKTREEAKKKIQQLIVDAMAMTMQQGSEQVFEAATDDIITSISAAFDGTAAATLSSSKSFSADLGAILGKALGEAPFKLLDDIFKDDE